MAIELTKQVRTDAIASLQRYFEEHLPEPIGALTAGLLLDFFVEEIGPAIYNRAIAEAQDRMQQRALDLTGELYAPEFPFWARIDGKRKSRR